MIDLDTCKNRSANRIATQTGITSPIQNYIIIIIVWHMGCMCMRYLRDYFNVLQFITQLHAKGNQLKIQ